MSGAVASSVMPSRRPRALMVRRPVPWASRPRPRAARVSSAAGFATAGRSASASITAVGDTLGGAADRAEQRQHPVGVVPGGEGIAGELEQRRARHAVAVWAAVLDDPEGEQVIEPRRDQRRDGAGELFERSRACRARRCGRARRDRRRGPRPSRPRRTTTRRGRRCQRGSSRAPGAGRSTAAGTGDPGGRRQLGPAWRAGAAARWSGTHGSCAPAPRPVAPPRRPSARQQARPRQYQHLPLR